MEEDVTLLATLEAQDDASGVVEDAAAAWSDLETSINATDGATSEVGDVGEESMGRFQVAMVGLLDIAGQVWDKLTAIAGAVGTLGAALDVAFFGAVQEATSYAGQLTTVEFLTGENAKQSAELIAGFRGVGISGDAAVSMLTRLSANLGALSFAQLSNGKISAAQKEEMKELGISFLNAHGDMLPMSQLLPIILDHLKNMTNVQERDILARKLFGRSFADLAPLIQAGGAAFVSASQDADKFGNVLSQGQVDALNHWKAAQETTKEALEGLLGTLAEKALPLLMNFEDAVKGVISAFNSLSPETRSAIGDALLLVATLGTLGGGLVALQGGLRLVLPLLGLTGETVGAIVAPILAVIAPILIVVAVLGALYLAYTHIKSVHDLLQPVVDRLHTAFVAIGNAIQVAAAIFRATGDPISAFTGALAALGVPMETIQGVSDTLRAAWAELQASAMQIYQAVLPALQKAWVQLQPAFDKLGKAMKELQPLWDILGVVLAGVGAIILILLGGAFQGLVAFLSSALPVVIGTAVNVINLFADGFKIMADVIGGVITVVEDLLAGHWDKAWQDAQAMFHNIMNDLSQAWTDLWHTIVGLLAGFGLIIVSTLMGIWDGVKGTFEWLKDELVGHSIIPDLINDIINWFLTLPDRVIGIVVELGTRMFNAAKDLGTKMINGIASGLSGLRYAILHAIKVALENLPGGMGNALIGPLGLTGYASGGLAGPSFGGPKFGVFGEGGQDEVIATMNQVMQAGMLAASNTGGGGGGARPVTVVNLYLDGKLIQRQVMKGAANDFRLKGGAMGSSA